MMVKALETLVIKLVKKKIKELLPELASKLPKDLTDRIEILEQKVREIENER